MNKSDLKNYLIKSDFIKEKDNSILFTSKFYSLLLNIVKILKEKLINAGFEEVYFSNDCFEYNSDSYSYFYIDKIEDKILKNIHSFNIKFHNDNDELCKHKTLDILSLFETIITEQISLPVLSGKYLEDNNKTNFGVFVKMGNSYIKIATSTYSNKKVIGSFSLALVYAMLMNHLDKNGFVIPPYIANNQVTFLMDCNAFSKDIKFIEKQIDLLKEKGVRASICASNAPMKEKLEQNIMIGTPLLIEVYHKNIEKNLFTLFIRFNNEKRKITINDFSLIPNILKEIQRQMYQKLLKINLKENEETLFCCMNEECLNKIKKDDVDALIPFMQSQNDERCVVCQQKSKKIIKILKKF